MCVVVLGRDGANRRRGLAAEPPTTAVALTLERGVEARGEPSAALPLGDDPTRAAV